MGNLKFVLGICFVTILSLHSIQGERYIRDGENQDGFYAKPNNYKKPINQRFQEPTTYNDQQTYNDQPYNNRQSNPPAGPYDFVTNFAWNLFLTTNNIQQRSQENLVLSPISPQLLFTIIGDISPNHIKREFTKCLGPLNSDAISTVVKSYKRTATSPSKNLIQIVSSAFYDEKLILGGDFENKLKKSNIQAVKIDFQSPQAANSINDWASRATQGEITKIIDAQSLATDKLIISNTVYFRGVWMNKFNETDQGQFYQDQRTTIPVEFMKSKNYLTNGHQGIFRWVELKYSKDEFSMLILLPKTRHGLEAAINQMTPELLRNVLSERKSGYNKRVNLSLPKFSISSQFSLIPPLKEMGLITPFTSNSDIPLLTSDSGPIQIGKVLHEARIRIDEYGTVASAATTVSVITLSAHVDEDIIFNVDEPFLAIIVDNTKNIPLFISKIYAPQ